MVPSYRHPRTAIPVVGTRHDRVMATREDKQPWLAVARHLGIGQQVARKRLRVLPDDEHLEALEADPPAWLVAAIKLDAQRATSRRAEARRRQLVDGLAIGVCGACQGQLVTRAAVYDDGCTCGADVGFLEECLCLDPEVVNVAWCKACNHIVTAMGATCRPDAFDSPFSFDDCTWW